MSNDEHTRQVHELQHSRASWEQMLAQAMELTWPKPEHFIPDSIPDYVARSVAVANAVYVAVEDRWPGVPRCSCPVNEEEETT